MTREKSCANYRFLTPVFSPLRGRIELPVFDASKEGFRMQDSVVRIVFPGLTSEASKTGSWRAVIIAENRGVRNRQSGRFSRGGGKSMLARKGQ